jgi:hypothetical protein
MPWSYYMSEVQRPQPSSSFCCVSPVLIKLGFLPFRFFSNDAHVDSAVRELFEETGLAFTVDDF